MRRKLAAIIAVDMVGFSRLIELSEEETISRQKEHRIGIFLPKFEAFGGSMIKMTGDGYLVAFSSVVDAIRCTIEVQKNIEVLEESIQQDRRIQYRIGVHLGDIVEDDADVYGDGVNIAARLEALAPTAGICISRAAHEQLRGDLGLQFEDMGEHQLKNISRPIQVFSWAGKPLSVSKPAQAGAQGKPTVALTPFKIIGQSNDEGATFAEGCNDALAAVLANFTGIDLVNHNTGPEHIVSGSFQCAGSKVRTIVKIHDTRNETSYLTSQFLTDITDIFEAQDDLAGEIGGTVRYGILQREGEINVEIDGSNTEALLNRAGHLMMGSVESEWIESDRLLDRIIELDSSNFMAFAMKAAVAVGHSTYLGMEVSPENQQQARQFLTRATELNDHSDFIYLIWSLYYVYSGDVETGLGYLNRGFEISPKFTQGLGILGLIQALRGQPREGIANCEKAAVSLARNRIYHRFLGHLAFAHWSNGDYPAAIEAADRALAQVPNYAWALLHMASASALCGKKMIADRAVQSLANHHPICTRSTVLKFPFSDPSMLDQYVEGLRLAGVPE